MPNSLNKLLGIHDPASEHAVHIDHMLEMCHWLMLLLFVGWIIFFGVCIWKFRRRKNPVANYHGTQSHVSTHLEFGVVLFEAFLLFGFAFPLWATRVKAFPKPGEAVVVKAVAEQFGWNFHYPGADGKFGLGRASLVTPQNSLGLDPADPAGADDLVVRGEMHLPLRKPAIIHVSSKDVIHNFSQTHLRVSQDAIPGSSIPLWFTPTKEGEFEIVCGQLCGLGHYSMKGILVVDPGMDEFNGFLKEQAALQGKKSAAQ